MSLALVTRLQLSCDYCGDVRTLPGTWPVNEESERTGGEAFGWVTLVTNVKLRSFCDRDCRANFLRHPPPDEVAIIDDETGDTLE